MSLTGLGTSSVPISRAVAMQQGFGAPAPADAPGAKTIADLLAAISKFIPGDVLGVFVTGEALVRGQLAPFVKDSNEKTAAAALPTASEAAKAAAQAAKQTLDQHVGEAAHFAYVGVWILLALSIVYVVALRYISWKSTPSKPPKRFVVPYWPAAAGAIAFFLFARESDVLFYSPADAAFGVVLLNTGLVLVAAIALPLINLVMPPDQQA
ncbi:MAG TPA: hypothetical protein VN224_16315 [Xanthomonadales bacterium]|nr:hypothetical protein [Xanthomonadales bacterium]